MVTYREKQAISHASDVVLDHTHHVQDHRHQRAPSRECIQNPDEDPRCPGTPDVAIFVTESSHNFVYEDRCAASHQCPGTIELPTRVEHVSSATFIAFGLHRIEPRPKH